MRGLLKKTFRRLRNRRTRRALAQGDPAAGRIVLSSTWDFPNPNHGYAYQEMLGLRELGSELCILYGERRPTTGLAARFAPLLDRLAPVETLASINAADQRALDRDHPGCIDAFLERVATATGHTVADLRRQPLVLRACTFARLCELARARYVQSWFFYEPSFMAMFASQVLGIPRGISCHIDHVLDDHAFKLVPLQLATADVVLAISERTRAELVAIGGKDVAARVLIKRVGVDGTSLRPLRTTRPNNGAAALKLVSVCRLEPKKGLITLLDAIDLLRRRGVSIRIELVGGEDPGNPASAPYAAELRQRIADLDLGGNVMLTGAVGNDAVARVLATADVFVAPFVELTSGDKDGIPTAMLEAMAAGLPVLCTDAGAMTEAITDDREGIVVSQGDAGALAVAIERFANDPALRTRLGAAAAERFDREFDCRVTESGLHDAVRRLLDARTTPGS